MVVIVWDWVVVTGLKGYREADHIDWPCSVQTCPSLRPLNTPNGSQQKAESVLLQSYCGRVNVALASEWLNTSNDFLSCHKTKDVTTFNTKKEGCDHKDWGVICGLLETNRTLVTIEGQTWLRAPWQQCLCFTSNVPRFWFSATPRLNTRVFPAVC